MMSILLLIAFAYGLDTLGKNYPAYGWAIAFGVAHLGLMLMLGVPFLGGLIGSILAMLYAWGYFAVLRRFGDNTLLWFCLLIGGALMIVLPSVLVA